MAAKAGNRDSALKDAIARAEKAEAEASRYASGVLDVARQRDEWRERAEKAEAALTAQAPAAECPDCGEPYTGPECPCAARRRDDEHDADVDEREARTRERLARRGIGGY